MGRFLKYSSLLASAAVLALPGGGGMLPAKASDASRQMAREMTFHAVGIRVEQAGSSGSNRRQATPKSSSAPAIEAELFLRSIAGPRPQSGNSRSSGRFLLSSAEAEAAKADAVDQARIAFENGDFAQAKTLLLSAVKSHPRNASLWLHLGVCYAQLGETESAVEALRTAHKLAPKNADILFDLGLLSWRSGNLAEAKAAYRAALELDGENAPGLQNYALLLMKTGEPQKAIAPLFKLKKNPSLSLPARIALIECYLALKDPAQVSAEVNELLAIETVSPADRTRLAAILVQHDSLQLAKRTLLNSLQADPAQDKAYAALGVIGLRTGDFADAAENLERAMHLAPDSAEYAMAYAQALLLWNRPDDLVRFLTSVEPKFGTRPDFIYMLGAGYYGVKNFSAAATTLESLLNKTGKRRDQVFFLLGNSYSNMGKLADAEAAYKSAIQINPKVPSYYESLAALLRREGPNRLGDAIAELERVYQPGSSDPGIALQLALCYERKENFKSAAAVLERLLQQDPELRPAHVALARVYLDQGNMAKAESEKKIAAALEQKAQPTHLGSELLEDIDGNSAAHP